MNEAARLAAVKAVLSELGCERLVAFFSGVPNFLAGNPVFLLTGFRSLGASAVSCAADGTRLLAVSPRWDEQRARERMPEEVRVVGASAVVEAVDELVSGTRSVAVVGLDDADERLRAAIEAAGVTLVEAGPALFDRTGAKTNAEIVRARRATEIAEQAYARLLETLRAGVTEYELAAELDAAVARAGGEDNFLLLSSGPVGGPVRQPTARRLERGDVLGLELSPCVEGQFVQICRTVVVGTACDTQREDYALLVRALQAGVAAARPGATAASITEAVNRPLVDHGYGDYCRPPYMRVRGHGLGTSGVSPGGLTSTNETVLEPSMLFVLHPNQHLPRSGYMLCGDPVVVTPAGAEVLASRPPTLDEVS